MTESTIPSVELCRVGCTNGQCLRVLPSSSARKNQKVVVGDQNGLLTCFKFKNTVEVMFTQTKEHEIRAVTLEDDRIYVAYGSTVEGIRKKGKVFYSWATPLNEEIHCLRAKSPMIWIGGEYVYNCFKDEEDFHFFMCNDIINDIVLVDLQLQELTPVLACEDKFIRVLRGSDVMHEISSESAVSCVHHIAILDGNVIEEGVVQQIIFGTEDGTVGQLFISEQKFERGWTIPDPGQGAVNSLSSYDFTKDSFPEIIIGRDNGNLDIYQWREGSKPFLLAHEQLPESITAVDTGYLTGLCSQDIVVSTYSGKILAFQCDPQQHFQRWEDATFGQTEFQFDAAGEMFHSRDEVKRRINALESDIQDYQREILITKQKYQNKSREVIAVATQFQLKHSIKLIPTEACYYVSLEIGIPIDIIAIRSALDIVFLDVDPAFALLNQHKPLHGSNQTCSAKTLLLIQAQDASPTRCWFKFRSKEGAQGSLHAYCVAKRIPKTCQSVTMPMRSLSLHSRVDRIQEDDNAISTLRLEGGFSAKQFNSWLFQCLPDVPSRITNEEVSLCWKSTFTASSLSVNLSSSCAILRSDSISALCVLQDTLSKLAVSHNVALSKVDIDVHPEGGEYFIELLKPQLDYYHDLFAKFELVQALREISKHESDLSCLSDEYREIVENADDIQAEVDKSPQKLEFLRDVVRCHVMDYCKMTTVNFTSAMGETLERALDDCDTNSIRDFVRKVA